MHNGSRESGRKNIFFGSTLGVIGENVKQIFAFSVLCFRLLISMLAINVCSCSLAKAILIIAVGSGELKYMNLWGKLFAALETERVNNPSTNIITLTKLHCVNCMYEGKLIPNGNSGKESNFPLHRLACSP